MLILNFLFKLVRNARSALLGVAERIEGEPAGLPVNGKQSKKMERMMPSSDDSV